MDSKILAWLATAPDWLPCLMQMPKDPDRIPSLHWDSWRDRPVIVCCEDMAKLLTFHQQYGGLPELIISIRYEGKPLSIKAAESYRR
jgi:hypothetical protein